MNGDDECFLFGVVSRVTFSRAILGFSKDSTSLDEEIELVAASSMFI